MALVAAIRPKEVGSSTIGIKKSVVLIMASHFIKQIHRFAITIFHKITNSAKLVILPIIPTYAKVSGYNYHYD
jgi:hypothetical protein